MPVGPGKYDDVCTLVREKYHADGAIVCVLAGDLGSGFSVQAPLDIQLRLPEILREIANGIEESAKHFDILP